MTPTSIIPTIVTSETFNYPNTDVILRSSGPHQINFRVHKLILSLSSPFFETMFTLPNAPQQTLVDELPVVDMFESATVIDTLLHIIYPIPDPPFNTLNADVLNAAHKFEMKAAFRCLRLYLTDPIFLEKEPLKAYAIVVTYNLKEEAKLASSYALRFNIIDEPLPEEMKKIPVQDYHRLLVLHRTREKAVRDMIKKTLGIGLCSMCLEHCQGSWQPAACIEVLERPTSHIIFAENFMNVNWKTCNSESQSCRWHTFVSAMKSRVDALPDTIKD